VPDLTALGTVTTGLQGIYDKLDYLDIPKHMTEDIASVQSMYIEPVEQMKQQAVNAFSEGDTGTGIRSIKDIQRFLHKAKQPGGIYNQFEQSYGAYQTYGDQLDTLYEKGEIGADRRDLLKQFSRQRFSGSFSDQGDFKPFSGISAAFEQDRMEKGLEIGKGWKSNKFPQGVYKTPNGYYNVQAKEFVDPKEVLNAVFTGLASDQSILNDLQQEAMLRGLKGDEATMYINDELKKVAAVVAEKEGFEQIDEKYLKDWMSQDSLAHARKMREIEYEYMLPQEQMQTGLIDIKADGALPKLKDGKIVVSERESKLNQDPLAVSGAGEAYTKRQYSNEGFDNMLTSNPDYFKTYPGFDKIIQELPRKTNGNDPETNEEYNKRALAQYERYRESHTTALGYDLYNKEQAKDTHAKVLGTQGNALGDLQNRRVFIVHPDKGLIEEEYTYLIKQAKGVENLRESTTFFGKSQPGNPGTPSGYIGSLTVGKGKNAKSLQFIVSPDNKQNEKIQTPMFELSSVEWTPGKFESRVVKYPFEKGVLMQARKEFVQDEEGNLNPETRYYQIHYVPKKDEEGNPVMLQDGSIDYDEWREWLGPNAKQDLLLDLDTKNKMKPRELDTDMTLEPAKRAKITQQLWQN
jgi:hypothetical protein